MVGGLIVFLILFNVRHGPRPMRQKSPGRVGWGSEVQGTISGKWRLLSCLFVILFCDWCHGSWGKRWQNPREKIQAVQGRCFQANRYDLTVHSDIAQHCAPEKGLQAEKEAGAVDRDCSFFNHSFVCLHSQFYFSNLSRVPGPGTLSFSSTCFSARHRPPIRPCDEVCLLRRLRRSLTRALDPLSKPSICGALDVV